MCVTIDDSNDATRYPFQKTFKLDQKKRAKDIIMLGEFSTVVLGQRRAVEESYVGRVGLVWSCWVKEEP